MKEFRFPTISKRIAIVGRNGTGKTQFAAWILSNAAFDQQPYVIIDYKRDELLNEIPYVEEIGYKDKIGKTGLYILHPNPSEEEDMEEFMWKIWEKEKTGLYIDEGYMVPNKGAFAALLTQGRSKEIPMITLSQRPAHVTRFVFSEANYFSIFPLNNKDDRKRISEMMPDSINITEELPQYYSHYYDVDQNALFRLAPAPDRDTLLTKFEARLAPKRRAI